MNRSLLVAQSPREVVVDEEAVDLLLKYFDIDRDGWLSYDEMMYMILPCTDKSVIASIFPKSWKNPQINELKAKYGNSNKSEYVKSFIIAEAKFVIKKEAAIHKILENLKQEIEFDLKVTNPGIGSSDSISSWVDFINNASGFKVAYLKDLERWQSNVDLNQSTQSTKFSYDPEDVYCAILRRIDSTGEGEITYEDLKSFITPSQKRVKKSASKSPILRVGDKENIPALVCIFQFNQL